MIEIKSCHNEVRPIFTKQCRRINEVNKGTVVAQNDGGFFRLADFIDRLQPYTAKRKVNSYSAVKNGHQETIYRADLVLSHTFMVLCVAVQFIKQNVLLPNQNACKEDKYCEYADRHNPVGHDGHIT